MSGQPRVVVIAGPNGSGKSTLTEILRADAAFGFPENYINADDIARQTTAGNQLEREQSAFRQARALRQIYRENRQSFAFETVFSHPSNLLDLLHLRQAGYEIMLIFVATSTPLINIGRVRARVRAGGHDVPVDRIRNRYFRTLRLLARAVEIVTTAEIYDSSSRITLIGSARNGIFTPRLSPLPEYYRTYLETPLRERALERDQLQQLAEGIDHPNETDERYTGSLRALTNHYVLQQADDGRLILHERCQIQAEIAEGDLVMLQYKDGYATVES